MAFVNNPQLFLYSLQHQFNHRHFAGGLRQDDGQFQRQRVFRRRAVQRRVDGVAASTEFDFAAVAEQLRIFHFVRQTGQMDMLERPAEEMQVEPFRLRIVRVATVTRRDEFRRSLPAAINGPRIVFHPEGVCIQTIHRPLVDVATGRRADVHQQVAAARHMVDQHLDAHFRRFP